MYLSKQITTLFITLLLTLVWSGSHAQIAPSSLPLETPIEAFRTEGGDVVLTLTINLEPDWYTYSDVPGGMGKPTKLTGTTADDTPVVTLYPEGIEKPDAFDPDTLVKKFLDGTKLYIFIKDGGSFPVQLRLDLLLCHPTKCVPARKDMAFGEELKIEELPVAEEQEWWSEFSSLFIDVAPAPEADAPQPEGVAPAPFLDWNFTPTYLQPSLEVSGLFSAILMGLLAGLILNIMPCVLPVVSLKLSALLNSGTIKNEEDRIAAFREHNAFFVLGVLAFFMLLAMVLGATGEAWGALFQKRWLVLSIAAVVFALSLSLFGLFHLPVIDLKFGTDSKSPRVQAFFTGNLTTLLATPCSGPFLGGVLSWALVQGPIVIATVFISIGIGMASPYILLIINPNLSRFLPKSGPWIEYVEKGIAFFLVGTSFYLVSIALGSEYLGFLAPLWVLILGLWLWSRTQDSEDKWKWGIRGVCAVFLIAVVAWSTPSKIDQDVWEPFNPTELSQRIGKEKLFVDFTAAWCPTCKVLEATVLTPENVARWKEEYGVKFIKVDMTERDVEAEALLRALGSASIPTAAYFGTGDKSSSPLVLRDLFTETQLENMLESWEK